MKYFRDLPRQHTLDRRRAVARIDDFDHVATGRHSAPDVAIRRALSERQRERLPRRCTCDELQPIEELQPLDALVCLEG